MSERDRCKICDRELHSIITRRLGENAVCIECGDKALPLLNALADNIVASLNFITVEHKMSVEDAIRITIQNEYSSLLNLQQKADVEAVL